MSSTASSNVDELYFKLLERAYSIITPKVQRRQEIPRLKVQILPKRTIILNFKEIAERLNRDPSHIAKFFLKELAVPGHIEGDQFVIYAERSQKILEAVYERYIKFYVVCPVCNSIDTILERQGRIYLLKCTACGATTPRKAI